MSDAKNRDGVTRDAVEFATWVVRYFDSEDQDSAYTVAAKFDAATRKARAEAFDQGAEALEEMRFASSLNDIWDGAQALRALAAKERA